MRLRMRPTSASTVLKSRCCRARVSMSACNCGARVTAKSDRRRSASGTSVSVASTLSRLPIEKNSPTRPNSLSSTATGTRTCVSPARSAPPAADPDDTENSPGTCPGSSRRNSPTPSATASATAPGGMAAGARQILHDTLDQRAGSRTRSRDIAQRDATPQQRPPRAGLRRQRLVETCRECGSQQIVKHDGRVRYTAVVADQCAEACRLPHQPGEGAHAFGAGLNRDALRDEPDAVEAQARACEGDGVDCLTETVFVPMDDCLRGRWKDFIQELGESPQQVEIVAEKAPRLVACLVGGAFT